MRIAHGCALIVGCVLLLAGGMLHAAEAEVPVKADAKGKVLQLLQAIGWEADEQQWILAGGEKTADILKSYLQDENRPEHIRLRALHVLRHFAPKAYILQFSRARHSLGLRRMAVKTMAEQWGAKALKELKDLAVDAEPLVRDAVASCLALIDGPATVNLLKTMASTEKHPIVSDTIGQALRLRKKLEKSRLPAYR